MQCPLDRYISVDPFLFILIATIWILTFNDGCSLASLGDMLLQGDYFHFLVRMINGNAAYAHHVSSPVEFTFVEPSNANQCLFPTNLETST